MGGSNVRTKTILATPTTGLTHHCTAHSNKGESTKFTFLILYAYYKNIIASVYMYSPHPSGGSRGGSKGSIEPPPFASLLLLSQQFVRSIG